MGCCVIGGEATLQDWKRWSDHPLRKEYEVLVDLGEGAFSSVVLAKHTKTGVYVALKVVYLENPEVDPEHLAILKREAEFLCMLDHPHIVECQDVVDNGRQQVLVLEYLRGGQLLDHLHTLGDSYSEQQAANIFAQVVDAVSHLHSYGIMHRDIKAENFVFAESSGLAQKKGVPLRLKLIDLGMAALYNPETPITGALGSPGFVSPEVAADGVHTPGMDVFAAGVLLFVMLVGRHPFNTNEAETLAYCHMDLAAAPGLQDPRWLALSPPAKDLCLGMLHYDPEMRLSMGRVAAHEWVTTRGGTEVRPLTAEVSKGAANLASLRRLRNTAQGVVAPTAAADQAKKQGQNTRERFVKSLRQGQAAADRTKGYRGDSSQRGISRLERFNLNVNARAIERLHDAGRTMEPGEDISHHYRPRADFHSVHGGSAYNGQQYHALKRTGTSVDVEGILHQPDFSTTPRALSAEALVGRVSGRLKRPSSWRSAEGSGRAMSRAAVIRSLLDASRHGRDAPRRAAKDASAHGGASGDGEGSRRNLSWRSGKSAHGNNGATTPRTPKGGYVTVNAAGDAKLQWPAAAETATAQDSLSDGGRKSFGEAARVHVLKPLDG